MDSYKVALSKFLGCSIGELKRPYKGSIYKYKDEEYEVFSEDEVEEEAIYRLSDMLESDGISILENAEYYLEYFSNLNKVASTWIDDYIEGNIDDLKHTKPYDEKFSNRFVEECYDDKLISDDEIDENGNYDGDEDDLCEAYAEYCHEIYGSPIEYLKELYGSEWVEQVLKSGELIIDYDGIAKEIIDHDGRGYHMSSYDGEEHEVKLNGKYYYIYRQN